MTFLEILSLIAGCAGIVMGAFGFARAQAAERAAETARVQAVEAAARAAAAGDLAAGALGRANEGLEASRSATAIAQQAQSQSTEALTRAARIAELAASASRDPDAGPATQPVGQEVRWECVRVKGGTWVARNIGSAVAHQALLTDATRPPKYIRPDEVIPRDVQPGDHLQFRATWDTSVRSPRIRVAWSQDGDPAMQSQELTLIVS